MKPTTTTLNRPREPRPPRVSTRVNQFPTVYCKVCGESMDPGPTQDRTICGSHCRSIYAQNLSKSSKSTKFTCKIY